MTTMLDEVIATIIEDKCMTWDEASKETKQGRVVCRTGKSSIKYKRKDGALFSRSDNHIAGGWRPIGVMWSEDTTACDWFVCSSATAR